MWSVQAAIEAGVLRPDFLAPTSDTAAESGVAEGFKGFAHVRLI